MFAYDSALAGAVAKSPENIEDVLSTMRAIQDICADGDGLKWFNWLYLRVTQAVYARIQAGGFRNSAWVGTLDVEFAKFYFNALGKALNGDRAPGCWRALFEVRNQTAIARIQFALAGINAHINHDLCQAIVLTCNPTHGSTEYADYTDLNTTLDEQIDAAKKQLNVRLLGDALPSVSSLENLVAAWGTAAAREKAWVNSEVLSRLQSSPELAASFVGSLDGLTTLAGKAVLAAVV